MKRYRPVLLLSAVCMVFLGVWSSVLFSNKSAKLVQRIGDTHAVAANLERAIGYGGLIHNFKNFVLRGDTAYYDAVRADVEVAKTHISEFETSSKVLGVQVELIEMRAMISAYDERLDEALALRLEGARPAKIDRVIRYSDEDALMELRTSLDRLTQKFQQTSGQLEIAGLASSLLSALALVAVALLSITIRHDQNLSRQLREANESLTEANQRMSEANTALKQFAGIASHDLQTPVRQISIIGSMIDADIDNPDALRRHAGLIADSTKRMRRLIHSLLDFTRNGFRNPSMTRIDLNDLVADVLESNGDAIADKNAKVEITAMPAVFGDRELLTRVFENLLHNSLKYASENDPVHIQISASEEAEEVCVSFDDNGIGILESQAERIFSPLQRLHPDEELYPGIGIGLSLVKSIVESHGGSVWLDTAYQKGARFKLTFASATFGKEGMAA